MQLRLYGADDIRRALPMRAAIDAARFAFECLGDDRATVPLRLAVPLPDAPDSVSPGTLLVKPASLPGAIGAKLVSVVPSNAERGLATTSGLVVLMDPATGAPMALLDGTFLTAWRTAATAALAIETLTSRPPRTAALIGAGGLARALIPALDAIDDVESVRVFARDRGRLAAFVDDVRGETRASLLAAESAASCVNGSEVIVTATTSSVPVVTDADLPSRCVICALGSFRPTMSELEIETIARASVVVDGRDAVAAEAGELVDAVAAGVTRTTEWLELGQALVGGATSAPIAAWEERRRDVVVFKSVGNAAQDVATAAAVVSGAPGRVITL